MVLGGPAVMGQLHIHRQDITSTRCDIHGLLAGMVLYGDSARAHASGTIPLIKFRDPHSMEIRSLSKAMCEGGSLRAVWVQSRKEHEYVEDNLVRRQRQALACVDSYAKVSHCQVMVESYSTWMDFDHYLLLDDELRPVVGNTPQYLFERAQADLRRGWIEKQSQKAPSRHTMTTDEIPMTNTEEWTDALRRFY
ncbi:hypothetical protein P3T76_002364 [Phytophthora citrophthora]|uniref:Uncharacterized protein n=1 Tax=Phytophthora citrophthora TaxID=4793 RepID=A0AAD9GXZ0_9STRA|nr:hypothetical protein P3T76_002364 [Phytophthora citrophthora]